MLKGLTISPTHDRFTASNVYRNSIALTTSSLPLNWQTHVECRFNAGPRWTSIEPALCECWEWRNSPYPEHLVWCPACWNALKHTVDCYRHFPQMHLAGTCDSVLCRGVKSRWSNCLLFKWAVNAFWVCSAEGWESHWLPLDPPFLLFFFSPSQQLPGVSPRKTFV